MPRGSLEVVIFNEQRYTRRLDSRWPSQSQYFKCNPPGKNTSRMLHRDIWEASYGPIPNGKVIHHIDGDPGNNALANLELCTVAEHTAIHDALNQWRDTPEGQQKMHEMGKERWQKLPVRVHVCSFCNRSFTSKTVQRAVHHCSRKCYDRHRRRLECDNEERTCVICGKTYSIRKYEKNTTCSKKCGFELRAQRLWPCVICGAEFKTRKACGAKYCSAACRKVARREREREKTSKK